MWFEGLEASRKRHAVGVWFLGPGPDAGGTARGRGSMWRLGHTMLGSCWGHAHAQPRRGWADESGLHQHLGGRCLALETSGAVAGSRPLGGRVVCGHPLLDSHIRMSLALASQPRAPVKLRPET